MQQVTVRVPASTSNLGPGFDCLGIALQIYNDITVARARERQPLDALVRDASASFFKHTRRVPFHFCCRIAGDIPSCRGLGGSATARLGVVHALNELTKSSFGRQQIFELVAKLEGHPDNAAPSEFGGFNVTRASHHQRFTVSSGLYFVLLIPNFEIATSKARRILPTRVAHLSAVASCGNACAITAAFASRRYENLKGVFIDHLHQPFRKRLIPFLNHVIDAGERAGALGGFLSGSGSTIICPTLRSPRKVAAAMLAASCTDARTLITKADNRGAFIY